MYSDTRGQEVDADDLSAIRNYPTPLICKPVIEKDGIVVLGEQDTWIVLPWASLTDLNEKEMVFTIKGKEYVFVNGEGLAGYVCSLG